MHLFSYHRHERSVYSVNYPKIAGEFDRTIPFHIIDRKNQAKKTPPLKRGGSKEESLYLSINIFLEKVLFPALSL